MNVAAVVVILLAHQGYWFGGDQGDIGVQWAARGGQPAADLSWELALGAVKVASGVAPMQLDPAKTVIRITPPQVRVRVTMRWKYAIKSRDGGRELEHGDLPIEIFPTSLLDGLPRRIGRSRVAVWDDAESFAQALVQAKASFARVASLSKLALSRPRAVFVGSDMLDESPFSEGPLIEIAEAGASVMIFRQERPDALAGYDLVPRDSPARLDWLSDHALLRGMDASMLKSLEFAPQGLLALRLPADEPALPIAAWPRELPGTTPVPIDACLLTKSVGKGRIVLCQLPLSDWVHDPRTQLLLMNAMDYLLTSPEPTPRASDRPATNVPEPRLLPSGLVLPGDRL